MEQKQAYVKKAKAELDLLQARLDGLEAKARKSEADGEIKYHQQIAELKAKRDAAKVYLSELNQSGKDAWGEIKEGFSRAVGDLKLALDQAASRFK